jgi:hypothetical protein
VASADANSDGRVDVVTGARPSGGPHVCALDAITLSSLDELFAFDPAFGGSMAGRVGRVSLTRHGAGR